MTSAAVGHMTADDSFLFTLIYVWRKVVPPHPGPQHSRQKIADDDRQVEKVEVLGCLLAWAFQHQNNNKEYS